MAETTSRFVEAFYDGLASGARVGDAMLKGRRQLEDDNFRGHVFGDGDLRIFEDEVGKMNRSLLDVKGSALVVSQFTLCGDARGQRRPSFVAAAPPEQAKIVYEGFAEALRGLGVSVATGVFGAMMSVELVNEGSVTILLDSDKKF